MKKTSYLDLLNKLYSINVPKGTDFRLERMHKALSFLGNPHKHFKSVHIAGTNGKGSVSLKMAEALMQEGKSVGLYTSPHIGTFRERIQVDGKTISKEDVCQLLDQVFEVGEGCTFFELTTLLAFLYFSKAQIEYAFIETGIGGRLDATNVVEPLISIITSVSFDHMEWLGSTLDAIAIEKAGIIKTNTPVVIGPTVPLIVEKIALQKNAPLNRVEGVFESFDAENSQVAKKGLELLGVSQEAINEGLKKRPPCRMEIIEKDGISLIFDVAHNPGGFSSLFTSLRNYGFERFRVVLGMGKDKDHQSCLVHMVPHAEEIILVQAEGVKEGLPVDILETILQSLHFERCKSVVSIKRGVEQAIACSQEDGVPVLIMGTFFIMAPAKAAAGIPIEKDFL